MKLNNLIIVAALAIGNVACTNSASGDKNIQKTMNPTIFGKWESTGNQKITTPFGTDWTLKTVDFSPNSDALTAVFIKEDGNEMVEHLKYEIVKNSASPTGQSVIFKNDFFKDLIVNFEINSISADNLQLKFQPSGGMGSLNFGSGILNFKKIK